MHENKEILGQREGPCIRRAPLDPPLELLYLLPFEWNSIRLGGPAHGIVTKTVHKTLPGGGRDQWDRG